LFRVKVEDIVIIVKVPSRELQGYAIWIRRWLDFRTYNKFGADVRDGSFRAEADIMGRTSWGQMSNKSSRFRVRGYG